MKEWTKTIKVGNVTVVIHRPELRPDQRKAREQIIETALAKYGRAADAAAR